MAKYLTNSADIEIEEVSGTENLKLNFANGNDLETRLNNLSSYSTTETVIGTWIDNKPIYRIAFSYTSWTGLGYNTGLSDIENIIDSGVSLKNTDSGQWMKLSKGDGDFNYYIKLSGGTYKIFIQNNSVYSADAVCCYIDYTKTTD